MSSRIEQKILDANLTIQASINPKLFEKYNFVNQATETYVFNFIFPLILDSKFEFLNETDKSNFKWKTPGILGYFLNGSNVYQAFDLNSVNFVIDSKNKSFLVKSEKFRLIQSHLKIDIFQVISQILEEFEIDQSDLTPYSLIINIDQTILNYFPESFMHKNWIFIKIFDLKLTYDFKFEENLNCIEDFQISFKDFIDKADLTGNKTKIDPYLGDNLKTKNSMVLIVNSTSSIFNQFDLNRWLDYSCMENSEAFGYRIRFVSALPSSSLVLNFETRLDLNERGVVPVYWKFKNVSQEKNFFILNVKNLEAIFKDLDGKDSNRKKKITC